MSEKEAETERFRRYKMEQWHKQLSKEQILGKLFGKEITPEQKQWYEQSLAKNVLCQQYPREYTSKDFEVVEEDEMGADPIEYKP